MVAGPEYRKHFWPCTGLQLSVYITAMQSGVELQRAQQSATFTSSKP
jgi:hypothetical protein